MTIRFATLTFALAFATAALGQKMPIPFERLAVLSAADPVLEHVFQLAASEAESLWGCRLELGREELGQKRRIRLQLQELPPPGVRVDVFKLRENLLLREPPEPVATIGQDGKPACELFLRGLEGLYVMVRRDERDRPRAAPVQVRLRVSAEEPLFSLWTQPDENQENSYRFQVRCKNLPAAGRLVCEWRFGDGTTQRFPFPTRVTHTYKAPGEYKVVVYVLDARSGIIQGIPSAQIVIPP